MATAPRRRNDHTVGLQKKLIARVDSASQVRQKIAAFKQDGTNPQLHRKRPLASLGMAGVGTVKKAAKTAKKR